MEIVITHTHRHTAAHTYTHICVMYKLYGYLKTRDSPEDSTPH